MLYPVEKARNHVMSSIHNPSGWNTDVYVYEIRVANDKYGKFAGYAIKLEDVFRYSHAVQTQSRSAMLNDALNETCSGTFKSVDRKLHETTIVHCSPYIEFASTKWKEDHDVVFGRNSSFGTAYNNRKVLVIATIEPILYPQFVEMAVEYANAE